MIDLREGRRVVKVWHSFSKRCPFCSARQGMTVASTVSAGGRGGEFYICACGRWQANPADMERRAVKHRGWVYAFDTTDKFVSPFDQAKPKHLLLCGRHMVGHRASRVKVHQLTHPSEWCDQCRDEEQDDDVE